MSGFFDEVRRRRVNATPAHVPHGGDRSRSNPPKHRPPAFRAATIAAELPLQLPGATVGGFKPVVEEQLGAFHDISAGKDKDAAILFVCFAVRRTRMVDPLGFVSAYGWVDHTAVIKPEENCVMWILRIVRRQPLRLFP